MRHLHAVALMMAASVGLAGCGEAEAGRYHLPEYTPSASAPTRDGATPGADDTPGADLVAASKAALAAAESVTVTGTIGDEYSVDLAFSGQDGSGTLSVGALPFRVRLVGGQAWYRGDDAAFYEAIGIDPAALVKATDARWLPSGAPQIASIEVLTSRDDFLGDFVDPGKKVAGTPATTIDGIAAVGLVNDTGTLYVATDTKLPVRLVGPDGDVTKGVVFSYDPVKKPTPPAPDEIIDPATLAATARG